MTVIRGGIQATDYTSGLWISAWVSKIHTCWGSGLLLLLEFSWELLLVTSCITSYPFQTSAHHPWGTGQHQVLREASTFSFENFIGAQNAKRHLIYTIVTKGRDESGHVLQFCGEWYVSPRIHQSYLTCWRPGVPKNCDSMSPTLGRGCTSQKMFPFCLCNFLCIKPEWFLLFRLKKPSMLN